MDLRPGFRNRFKGNPQQGTLFHASAEELDPTGKRYPRGYTPERQREVWNAVGDVGHSGYDVRVGHDDDAVFPYLASDAELSDPHTPATDKQNWGEGRAVIRDAVARSTVPLDVVRRTRFGVTPNVPFSGLYGPKDETILFGRSSSEAREHREGFGTGNPTPSIQSLDQGQTVIHELGHAADPTISPLRGRRNVIIDRHGENPVSGYVEPEDLGAAEEFADDFAKEHFRPDPRVGRRESFAMEAVSYPGRDPADIPPRHLAGYSKWRARSDTAMEDLEPRYAAAERAGGVYPQTPNQRSYAARRASQRDSVEPQIAFPPRNRRDLRRARRRYPG
jgi:hypothetical protein